MSMPVADRAMVVTVCCLTYNQRRFVEDTLDGFVRQRVTVPVEIIIHDDASDDGTADVVSAFARAHPGTVRAVLQSRNQMSQGVNPFVHYIWPLIRGRYVAICEGDDYWTDPLKLQKQVDHLDAHPDQHGCFHPVRVVHDDGAALPFTWPTRDALPAAFDGQGVDLQQLLKANVVHTPSVMYRWRFHDEAYPGGTPPHLVPFDWFLHLLHAAKGPLGLLPDVMAVYRRHTGGMWWDAGHDMDAIYRRHGVAYARFVAECARVLGQTLAEPRLRQTLGGIVRALAHAGDVPSLEQIAAMSPRHFDLGVAAMVETAHASALASGCEADAPVPASPR